MLGILGSAGASGKVVGREGSSLAADREWEWDLAEGVTGEKE